MLSTFDGQRLCRHGNNLGLQLNGDMKRNSDHDYALASFLQSKPTCGRTHASGSKKVLGGMAPGVTGGTVLENQSFNIEERASGMTLAACTEQRSRVLFVLQQVKQRGSFSGVKAWLQTARQAGASVSAAHDRSKMPKELAHEMAQHEREITRELINRASTASLGQDGADNNLLILSRMVLWRLPTSVDKKHLPPGVEEVLIGQGAPWTADRVLGVARCGLEGADRKGVRGDRSAKGLADETAYYLKAISGDNYENSKHIWRSYVSDNAKDEVNTRQELVLSGACPALDIGDQDTTHSFQIVIKHATKGVPFVQKVQGVLITNKKPRQSIANMVKYSSTFRDKFLDKQINLKEAVTVLYDLGWTPVRMDSQTKPWRRTAMRLSSVFEALALEAEGGAYHMEAEHNLVEMACYDAIMVCGLMADLAEEHKKTKNETDQAKFQGVPGPAQLS